MPPIDLPFSKVLLRLEGGAWTPLSRSNAERLRDENTSGLYEVQVRRFAPRSYRWEPLTSDYEHRARATFRARKVGEEPKPAGETREEPTGADKTEVLTPLSARLRAGSECAPWVIEEVRKLEEALTTSPQAPAQQGWISPRDKVPKGGQKVLCKFADKGIHTAVFRGTSTTHGVFDAWHGFLTADVTSDRLVGWMPLAAALSASPQAPAQTEIEPQPTEREIAEALGTKFTTWAALLERAQEVGRHFETYSGCENCINWPERDK